MTGICVRTLSVAATALLPLGQPLRLVLSGDPKDPSDLWVRVAARLLEFNRSQPALGGAAVAGHMHVGPLLAVAHAKAAHADRVHPLTALGRYLPGPARLVGRHRPGEQP